MRRPSRAAIALAVATALAAPAAASAQAPAEDAVTGRGVAAGYGAFAFDVRSGPSGEGATGRASLGPLQDSPIACLAVQGNVARFDILAGRITAMIEVTDNAGLGIPDVVRAASALLAPATCGPLGPFAAVGAVLDGDIVVVDAPPLPVTKDRCKNGGWRSFGIFRNQGDCVSSVVARRKGPAAAG